MGIAPQGCSPLAGRKVGTVSEMTDQMAEAVKRQMAAMDRSYRTDRTGWTQEQWIEDADRLMNELDGAVTSLVNGHVLALLDYWRASRQGDPT